MPRGGLSIYQPIADYLAAQPAEVGQVELTLAELAAIVGFPLPASAWDGKYWNNGQREAHARSWRQAGWRVAKGPGARFGQRVRFVRVDGR